MQNFLEKNMKKVSESCKKKQNEPIRVLQVGMHDKIGGVETFLMNYYRKMDRNKVQFDFINMFEHLCFEDEIKKMGGMIYKVPNVKKKPFKYYKELRKIIRLNNYKIIHINMLSMANILPIIAAHKEGVKHIILHSHNSGTPKGILRKILDKMNKKIAIKYANHYFACSTLAGKWLYGNETHFEVINNAIDVNKFKFDENKRKNMRRHLNLEDKFVIGHVGRFCEQKNHKFLIEILRKYLILNPKTILLTIGEGELKNEIKSKALSYNLQDNIIFMDPIDNVNDYLQAMDVFVLPSLFEGLPVVAVEAEANGLTVITSNTVSKELPIKELSVYCDLNYIDEWCKKIQNNIVRRMDRTDDITNANYNIEVEAKKLTNMYIKMLL